MKYNKFSKIFLLMFLLLGTVTIAFGCDNNEHNFSSAWSKDDANHWHDCSDENCDEKKDLKTHTYGAWETVSSWELDELGIEDVPIGMIVEKRTCSVCEHTETRFINPAYSFENAYQIDLTKVNQYYGFSVTEGSTYYFSFLGDTSVSKIIHIYSELYSPKVNMVTIQYNSSKTAYSTYKYYTEIVGMPVQGGEYIAITALNSGRIVIDFN